MDKAMASAHMKVCNAASSQGRLVCPSWKEFRTAFMDQKASESKAPAKACSIESFEGSAAVAQQVADEETKTPRKRPQSEVDAVGDGDSTVGGQDTDEPFQMIPLEV